MKAKLLATATIGKTHGVEGFLRVYSLSGNYKGLKKLKACVAKAKDGREFSLTVEAIKAEGELFLMKFSGFDGPEKARVLTNSEILIKREDAPRLKKGEYFQADLPGMSVLVDGVRVGEVTGILEGAQSLLLEVKKDDNEKKYLVPVLDVYVGEVDVESDTLVLKAPFLLD